MAAMSPCWKLRLGIGFLGIAKGPLWLNEVSLAFEVIGDG